MVRLLMHQLSIDLVSVWHLFFYNWDGYVLEKKLWQKRWPMTLEDVRWVKIWHLGWIFEKGDRRGSWWSWRLSMDLMVVWHLGLWFGMAMYLWQWHSKERKIPTKMVWGWINRGLTYLQGQWKELEDLFCGRSFTVENSFACFCLGVTYILYGEIVKKLCVCTT